MTDVDGQRLPMIGYMIHRPFWRKRYGLEAASGCILHILHARNEPKAYTLIRPENGPSMALAEKMGMKPLRTVLHDGFEHLLLAHEQKG
jgi:RimJ/RimL family protein N-acetyltransferase